jgi:predicted PurR-regulated permease PerM
VTYLAGDPGVSQLVLILCCYLVYNGIIEQFILYPMVIGESLGLTTLETIIVVLLGAIFAGIAGMILALPAASVIKYLVPQIYRCWDVFLKRGRNEQGTAAP